MHKLPKGKRKSKDKPVAVTENSKVFSYKDVKETLELNSTLLNQTWLLLMFWYLYDKRGYKTEGLKNVRAWFEEQMDCIKNGYVSLTDWILELQENAGIDPINFDELMKKDRPDYEEVNA